MIPFCSGFRHCSLPIGRWVALVGAVLTLALAGCGGDDGSASNGSETQPTITGFTVTEPTATRPTDSITLAPTPEEILLDALNQAEGSGCIVGGAELPDGRYYGLVGTVNGQSLEFDLACWLTGEAAQTVSDMAGEGEVPNDYYVWNHSQQFRTLAVAEDSLVEYYPDGDPANVETLAYAEWPDRRAERAYQLGVWLTVADGQVMAVMEQWVP